MSGQAEPLPSPISSAVLHMPSYLTARATSGSYPDRLFVPATLVNSTAECNIIWLFANDIALCRSSNGHFPEGIMRTRGDIEFFNPLGRAYF